VLRLTGPDAPAPSSWALEQAYAPQPDAVVRAVRAQLGMSPEVAESV
jgi:pyruvate/2-oxoglutarate/acetoin dehydrogenase E1 component